MRKFYALYDHKDNFISCGYNAKDLGIDSHAFSLCLHKNKGKRGRKIFEIPLTVQNDVFQEEDILFLQEEGENVLSAREIVQKQAKEQGVSTRHIYRINKRRANNENNA
jgi:hypothetical protein